MSTLPPARPTPWWMWLVITVCALPGLSFPWVAHLIADSNPVVRGLAWLYPAYVVCSALLAWLSWRRSMTAVCWIILALLAVSHLCFYYLAVIDLA